MAWYRQYRPRLVAELNLQQVRSTLQAMMQSGNLPQTLLFTGPKGTGKTSAARILGALLNDPANAAAVEARFFKNQQKPVAFVEPDPDSEFAGRVYRGASFVVQELDAASNRRIDDIRALKERVHLAPQEGKMTVYILDEVHMLTSEAFNALLKLLEEPPAHVCFILATTELHKLPATIVSRCSVVNFYKASSAEIVEALERILQAEKIKYELADLEAIVKRADGSFRDAVKILEMACAAGHLDLSLVKTVVASDNQQLIVQLLTQVMGKEAAAVAAACQQLRQLDLNQRDFYQDLFSFLHQDLLANLGVIEQAPQFAYKVDHFFLQQLLAADLQQETPIAFLPLEIKLLELIERSKQQGKPSETPPTPPTPPKKKFTTRPPVASAPQPTPEPTPEPPASVASVSSATVNPVNPTDFWHQLLDACVGKHLSLSTLLKSCRLDSLEANTAKIMVYYPFHKEQLEQHKNLDILQELSRLLFGQAWQFHFELNEAEAGVIATHAESATAPAASELLVAARDSLL